MSVNRRTWLHDVEEVIRSRHYTWIPEGLGGESVEVAMSYLMTDIMHICKRTDASFDEILETSRKKFLEEELEAAVEQASS